MTIPTTPTTRPLNWAALIEAVLLGGAAAMLLAKIQSGTLVYYIHPRYTVLIVACTVVLVLIAAARLRGLFVRPTELLGRLRWRYILLALPLLVGTLVPARPLGAGALSGAAFDVSIVPGMDVPDDDTHEWNLLQWATALSVRGDELQGREADIVGFVYHDPARQFDGFFAVRYVVTCCTADGNGAGLPVVWKGGAALPPDSWVRVRGKLGTTVLKGQAEPALIAAVVDPVPQPANPYLYP
jgi:uncharacterized repeat protein (TIGR03943 family)